MWYEPIALCQISIPVIFLPFIQADTQILQNPQNKSASYLSPQDSYYGVRIKLRTLGFRGKH